MISQVLQFSEDDFRHDKYMRFIFKSKLHTGAYAQGSSNIPAQLIPKRGNRRCLLEEVLPGLANVMLPVCLEPVLYSRRMYSVPRTFYWPSLVVAPVVLFFPHLCMVLSDC